MRTVLFSEAALCGMIHYIHCSQLYFFRANIFCFHTTLCPDTRQNCSRHTSHSLNKDSMQDRIWLFLIPVSWHTPLQDSRFAQFLKYTRFLEQFADSVLIKSIPQHCIFFSHDTEFNQHITRKFKMGCSICRYELCSAH